MYRITFQSLVAVALASLAWCAITPPSLAASDPPTMKAVRIDGFGGVEVMKYEDAAKPVAGPDQVLIHIRAAGVNPVDWKIREGMLRGQKLPMPFILGFDVSGVVETVGDSVKDFKVGDEVYAYLSLMSGGGYAEYVAAPASTVTKKPTNVDHVKAAAVPLAALTAWQALFDRAGLKSGQTVLIHGAAGGVGHFAVQLAKAKGAKVIATASEKNLDFVKGLGADQVIDYRKQKFEEVAKDVDVVFDMIGGDTLERSYGVVKEGGFVVSIVAPPNAEKLAARKARGAVLLVKPDAKELAEITTLIESGAVKPEVSATFALKDAAKAHEKSKAGVDRGKIVLTVP
ncbi:MAG: NADP-dependent oxidoreductase [Phycisphaerales bacterium]